MSANADIRPATPQDVPVLESLMLANESGPTFPAGGQQPYLAHLVARGTVAVAVGSDGVVLGFGASVDSGRSRHLADLFVLPSAQSQGLGGALVRTVMEDAWPRTTFASDDPRALPLYVRAGMLALHPNIYLVGDARGLECPDGYAVEAVSLDHMSELELAWAGVDRGPDLPHWATTPGTEVFVVTAGGREVATGLSRPRKLGTGRWMDHVVASPDADGTLALTAAMAAEAGLAEQSGACVLGPSPLVRVLLEAGFRIVDRDTYLSSDATLVDPTREIVNTGFL